MGETWEGTFEGRRGGDEQGPGHGAGDTLVTS